MARVWIRSSYSWLGTWGPWREVVSHPENSFGICWQWRPQGDTEEPFAAGQWAKGASGHSPINYIKAYVYGSSDPNFIDTPEGTSSFGSYLYSDNKDEPAIGIIDVTNVSTIPVILGAGGSIPSPNPELLGGVVYVEEYSDYPGP